MGYVFYILKFSDNGTPKDAPTKNLLKHYKEIKMYEVQQYS